MASAARGFKVYGYHEDSSIIVNLQSGHPQVLEPGLPELFTQYHHMVNFSDDIASLSSCDIVYISVDVPTDDNGKSDLSAIVEIIDRVVQVMQKVALLVILCQVPPGFTRKINWPSSQLYYQVETLVFGRAVQRAMFPERFIVGCANPSDTLDLRLKEYLAAFECPILPMRYESAELAKISINMFLVATVTTANTLAEICEQIGADWSEIVPALRLDKRIGQHAYLSPGLGIAGGNLERDLSTVLSYSQAHDTDGGVVAAWVANSIHRKDWAWQKLKELVLNIQPNPTISILGLTYKENTHSVKNSASISLLKKIRNKNVKAFDPAADANVTLSDVLRVQSIDEALKGADVLIIMTPWPEFGSIKAQDLKHKMSGRIVIDPYRMLGAEDLPELGFTYAALGEPIRWPLQSSMT